MNKVWNKGLSPYFTNCPNLTFKNAPIYYQTWIDRFGISFENSYLANETRYIDSDVNFNSTCNSNTSFTSSNNNNLFQTTNYFLQTNYFFLVDCLFVCLENLAVQPNSEKPGSPNSPTNKKIFLSSFKYDLLNKHVKSSDQQMGAVHPVLSGVHPVLSGAHLYLSGVDVKFVG